MNEEIRQKLLDQVTTVLSTSLNEVLTINQIASSIVSGFADYCRIVIVDENGNIQEVGTSHKDPKKIRLATTLLSQYIDLPKTTHGVHKILSSGIAETIPVVNEEILEKYKDENAEMVETIKKIGLQSYIGVPLTARNKVFGAIVFSSIKKGVYYSQTDFLFAQELGRRIALTLDNFSLYKAAQKEIEERKKIEQDLVLSEKRFRSLIEHSTDGFRLISKKGEILYASPSTEYLLGYSLAEYLTLNVLDLIHPDDRKPYKESIKALLTNPTKSTHLTYRFKHKNGEYRWFEGFGTNLLDEPGVNAIVSNFRDITDRKTMEDELEMQRERMSTLLANVPAVVWEAYGKPDEANQQINFVNNYVEKMLGYTVDEWLATPNFWLKIVHPDDREKAAKQAVSKYSQDNVGINRFRWVHKDGKSIWVEAQSYVIYDTSGKPIGMRGVTFDISESRALEARKNEFISMASHELKTPITSMKLFIEVLVNHLENSQDEKTRKILSRIQEQTDKLRDLVSDLLDISRIETGKLKFHYETFSLNKLIEIVIDDIRSMTTLHTMVFENKESSEIWGDKFRIEQVITNLLTNAIKYSPKGGQIHISLKRTSDHVLFSIKDSGLGIPKKHQEKIFERLYQVDGESKRTPSGLGMGLYISKEIITRHGGKIWVESKLTKGSTFYFTLPITRENKN